MIQTEKQFMKAVIDLAHSYGWSIAHFKTAHIQRADGVSYYATPVQADGEGFPDLVLAKRGEPIYFIELKTNRGKLTERQENWLYLLNRGSSPAMVFRPCEWELLVKLLEPRGGRER